MCSAGKMAQWWQNIIQVRNSLDYLRPNSWKSESHLNQKQVNRCKANPTDPNFRKEHRIQTQPHSKSSDWTDVPLEVPDNDDAIHLRNPKLALIFDNNSNTPTPPPRKYKKGLREKIEAVAKTGLQAFQSKKPVEEPLCVKKTINYVCPVCEKDCAIHNRDHVHNKTNENKKDLKNIENDAKQAKRRKNLSVVSLPNYSDLKLSVASFDDIDKNLDSTDNSLQNDKKLPPTASNGKLDKTMTRCRSFGSLLPQQLLEKLRVRKIPIDIESDDSFGGLEDWDLRIIEHYNPKEASLPRRPPKTKQQVLTDIESLIVKDEDIEKPTAPTRKSESLLKKINREASESAVERRSLERNHGRALSVTPPPTPEQEKEDIKPCIRVEEMPIEENGKIEHSSLMKILEEFSIRDKQKTNSEQKMTNGLIDVELQKKINSVEDFLNNEKLYINRDMQHAKLGDIKMVKT